MIKSIFVDPLKVEGINKSGANHLIITLNGLTPESWKKLQNLKMTLSISITAFDSGGCPADPKAFEKLKAAVDRALKYKPAEIWLDHFRFDGRWEDGFSNMHSPCKFCQGKSRVQILSEIAKKVMSCVNNRSKIGYFAVPFKPTDVPQLISNLGQDHSLLGKIFDLCSPMLYHRMIKKSVNYISDYVSWIYQQTERPVLPIIQIKDMPDNLPDKLTEPEITEAFKEAIKPPSQGVCFFNFTQALEKNSTNTISKLFDTM